MPLGASSFYGNTTQKPLGDNGAHRMTYRSVIRRATGWPPLEAGNEGADTSSILFEEFNKQAQAVSRRCELIGWSSQWSPGSSSSGVREESAKNDSDEKMLVPVASTDDKSKQDSGKKRASSAFLERIRNALNKHPTAAKEKIDAWKVGTFAREVRAGGIRKYIVDSFDHFCWSFGNKDYRDQSETYKSGPGLQAHNYEVVLEGNPCWLYFDLEYPKAANPHLNEVQVMLAFTKAFLRFFKDQYGTDLSPPEWTGGPQSGLQIPKAQGGDKIKMSDGTLAPAPEYEFDYADRPAWIITGSSTDKKFSRHVVIKYRPRDENQVPTCFADNAVMGYVVRTFVDYCYANRFNPQFSECAQMFCADPSLQNRFGENANFNSVVDLSVYSRNRCFRLLWHSKIDKRMPLKIACEVERQHPDVKTRPELYFLRSLVTFVPPGRLFAHSSVPEDAAMRGRERCGIVRGHVDGATGGMLMLPEFIVVDGKAISRTNIEALSRYSVEYWDMIRGRQDCQNDHICEQSDTCKSNDNGFDASRVGNRVLGQSYENGKVTSLLFYEETSTLILSIAGNRFCEYIGRSHKSNGIMLVLDLPRGVLYQKCHDFSCNGFRSQSYHIPPTFLESAGLEHAWGNAPPSLWADSAPQK